jgi:hypothetical protein
MFNFPVILAAALVPLLIGFIWYNPKVFGNIWMKGAGLTMDSPKYNMALVFGLTYLFGIMAAMALYGIVIHQNAIFSTLMNEPGFQEKTGEAWTYANDFMEKYGKNFRTFKHGALHGTITGVFLGIPLITVSALFERKPFSYIAINFGYWIITLAIMGGIVCQWG